MNSFIDYIKDILMAIFNREKPEEYYKVKGDALYEKHNPRDKK